MNTQYDFDTLALFAALETRRAALGLSWQGVADALWAQSASLNALYAAMDAKRRENALTWPELAKKLCCTANQLTGLRTARFATGMVLAMRIVQWLARPASEFIDAAQW